mgnify:CR=1 FL=1
MKKSTISNIVKYSLFILLVVVTFYVVFQKNDFGSFLTNLREANLVFIALGMVCMLIFLGSEASNIKLILKNLGHKLTYIQAFRYSLVGFFFSSITPSSTGGQPAQIYFMNKDGIPIAHSTMALLVELMGYQFATGLLAFIGFFLNFKTIVFDLGNIKFLIFLGLTVNLIILSVLIVTIFSKNLALKILGLLTKILSFFHYSKVDKFEESFTSQIDEYHRCSIYLKENKHVLIKALITNVVQLIAYHAIPYCVYLSFGLSGASAITIILMEAVLYVAVASLPFPGSVGVSEGTFMVMFKLFFPATLLGSAMIISRGISFYFFVLLSALGVIWSFIKSKRSKKRES